MFNSLIIHSVLQTFWDNLFKFLSRAYKSGNSLLLSNCTCLEQMDRHLPIHSTSKKNYTTLNLNILETFDRWPRNKDMYYGGDWIQFLKQGLSEINYLSD